MSLPLYPTSSAYWGECRLKAEARMHMCQWPSSAQRGARRSQSRGWSSLSNQSIRYRWIPEQTLSVIWAGEVHQYLVVVFRPAHDSFLKLYIPSSAPHEPFQRTVGSRCRVCNLVGLLSIHHPKLPRPVRDL